jgi:transcriptional regulator with GAF, ATPase, and Fis domain
MSSTTPPNIVDLTRDLEAATQLSVSVDQIDELLGEAIDTLGRLVPFDLATIMELDGNALRIRVARGPLASPRVKAHRLPLARFPGVAALLQDERAAARAFTEADHREGDGDAFDGVLDLPAGHSCMVVPLRGSGRPIGIMTFDRTTCGEYPQHVVELADTFGRLLALAMTYGQQSAVLSRFGEQLREENRLLGERLDGRQEACALMEASRSAAMRTLVEAAQRVAATDTPVLITGETGTGKEVLANAIHGWSRRAKQPLVGINCAALPANLIESELFGHVKGAFSGASKKRLGRFQTANGGTLFLDEIGEMPIDLQAKLLRALQEGCFEPLGSDRSIRVDVRVIAAANTDLLRAVAEGRFRQDLYYRLAVFPVHLPPLRERSSDIAAIADGFLQSLARRTGRGPWHLSPRSQRWLQEQSWRGNVRELVNTLERATILATGPELDLEGGLGLGPPATGGTERAAAIRGSTAAGSASGSAGGAPAAAGSAPFPTLKEMERRHIEQALELRGGRIYGADGCAELLGIHPSTLRSRMQKLGMGGARAARARS